MLVLFDEGHPRGLLVRRNGEPVFGDMVEELVNLDEWAFKQGYDKAMTDRIARLVKLAAGEEVPDV